MTSIVLTGFMGTGKTAVGRELARHLGLPFIDTDEEIERSTGRTVQQFFDEQGEAAFRAIEHCVVGEILARDGIVVATGGGALIDGESRALLDGRHRVVCLTADFEAIESRLNGGTGRPLAQNTAELCDLLKNRQPVYSLFEQVDTTNRTIWELAIEIAARVETVTTLQLDVEDHRRSDIVIGPGVATGLPALFEEHGLTGQIILVTDSHVAGAGIAGWIKDLLDGRGRQVTIAEIPAGESHKTLETLERLYSVALAQRFERSDIVVGLGGGVVGDVAGMLAATYLRGLRLVLVPTTLLAQVDAAIGGKVGVDLQGVKNMIGAFYPAELIVVDPSLLETLPAAELRIGMAEIVKIAAMRSEALFEELENLAGTSDELQACRDVAEPSVATQSSPIRPDAGDCVRTEASTRSIPVTSVSGGTVAPSLSALGASTDGDTDSSGGADVCNTPLRLVPRTESLTGDAWRARQEPAPTEYSGWSGAASRVRSDIVRHAVQLKVDVVREDLRERGVRAQLNFGHTIGHGIEAASDFAIAHGEAVSIGMIAECRLAEREGWARTGTADRIEALLARTGLPTRTEKLDRTRVREAIGHDKKRAAGQIRIAVPEDIGRGTVRVISAAQLDRGIDIALGNVS